MPKVPELVTVGSDGFSLPVEEILTGRGFITGKSGAGKSNTASVVAEELLSAGISLFIIDTDGEYYGLKEQFDVLHAGADSDCDIEVGIEDAQMLAETALEEEVPVILDVSGFLDGEQVNDLIEKVVKALFTLEKQVRKPFPLFVEEVHEFIPEAGGLDDLGEMLIRVAKRGRKRGLGLVGASQRPAAVDKDFITQCDWIVWHRLTWDNDTRVVGQILGGDAADAVQDLETGEALVMTDWDESVTRVKFRRKRTLDAGATPGLAALQDDADVDVVPEEPGANDAPPPDAETPGSAAGGGQPATTESADAPASEPASAESAAVEQPSPDAGGVEAAGSAAEPAAQEPAGGGQDDDSTVIVEPVDESESRDRSDVVERLAAKRQARDVDVSEPGAKRAPAEAHPNDNPPVRVLWEFGHMMTHVFKAGAMRSVALTHAAARSAVGGSRKAASIAARTARDGGRAVADSAVAAKQVATGATAGSAGAGNAESTDGSGETGDAAEEPDPDQPDVQFGEDDRRLEEGLAADDRSGPSGGHVVRGDREADRTATDENAPGDEPAADEEATAQELDLSRGEELFVKTGLVVVALLLLLLAVVLFV